MADTTEQTEYLELTLPAADDLVDIATINANMTIIDTAVARIENPGVEKEGMFLIVNAEGKVEPTAVPSANGVSF